MPPIVHNGYIAIKDGKGKVARTTFHIKGVWGGAESSEDIIEAFEYVRELAIAIGQVIDGEIVGLGLAPTLELPNLGNGIAADSDVEEGVKIKLRTDQQSFVQLRIPTIKETLLDANGQLDMTNADVTALRLLLVSPEELPADWIVGVCDNRGADVVAWESANESFTRSRG
jgi:hypothetical protein